MGLFTSVVRGMWLLCWGRRPSFETALAVVSWWKALVRVPEWGMECTRQFMYSHIVIVDTVWGAGLEASIVTQQDPKG